MKISLLQENLAKGVSAVSRMVASKAQLPVLSNILLATEKGKLRLSATNLETGMNWRLNGKATEEGRITVPAKVLVELVSSLPKETVELTTDKDKLKISCGQFRSVINGIGAQEFPEVPSLKETVGKKESLVKLKSTDIREAVEKVALAAGADEARPIFTGVKMEFGKSEIRLAATDGYRLSIKSIGGVRGLDKQKEMVVPARALMELIKVLVQEDAEEIIMAATEEEKQLILAVNEVEVVTRLLEGEFPDFDKIIPESRGTRVELEKEELYQAVKVAAIFARDSANIVRFRIKGNGLMISANAPQVGENEVGLNGKITGEDAEIAFNSRYLIEMLSVVKEDKICLETTGSLSPGVFRAIGDDFWMHIIMPVRVQE